MATAIEQNKLSALWLRYRSVIISLFVSLYCLPLSFFAIPGAIIEASWKKALNYCVDKGFTFGTDFIFTYGPLGYLSSRHGQYVGHLAFIAFDAFLLSGFFWFTYKYIADKKWWWLIMLPAMIFLRGSNYSQVLFIIFILFTAINFINNFSSYFELLHCSFAGILLFFIKLNYGLISLMIIAVIAACLLFKNRKTTLIFIASSLLFFCILAFSVHLNIVGYTRYGYLLIKGFDESMSLPVNTTQFPFLWALLLMAIFAGIAAIFLWQLHKRKAISFNGLAGIAVLGMACYLFYRNAFTRADYWHWCDLFAVFPLFITGSLVVCGFGNSLIARGIAISALVVAAYGNACRADETGLSSIPDEDITKFIDGFSLKNYFTGVFEDYEEDAPLYGVFPPDKANLIGHATVDVFPYDIQLLYYNKFNYLPRPVPQSYTVYDKVLDSLNAAHFYNTSRPEFVLMQNIGIDDRYPFWDESVTKAALHLNYQYADFLGSDNDSVSLFSLLFLKAKPGVSARPEFKVIKEIMAGMEEVIPITFPENEAIYMTADINYDASGKMKRLVFQPPYLAMTLFFSDGSRKQYRAIRPLLAGPVLINKSVVNSIELKNFMTGALQKNRNITGISFNPVTPGFDQKIRITFLKFSNY